MDTSSSTTPVLRRVDVEPPVEHAGAGVVACPHCGGRIDAASTSAVADAAEVPAEPGPRDADEVRAVRAAVAADSAGDVRGDRGPPPVRAARRGGGAAVLRYVRAARGVGGGALVLRSVRLCFPAEQVVEVAAVARAVDRVRAVAARFEHADGGWRCVVFRIL